MEDTMADVLPATVKNSTFLSVGTPVFAFLPFPHREWKIQSDGNWELSAFTDTVNFVISCKE